MAEINTIANLSIPLIGLLLAIVVYRYDKKKEIREVKFQLIQSTDEIFSVIPDLQKLFVCLSPLQSRLLIPINDY